MDGCAELTPAHRRQRRRGTGGAHDQTRRPRAVRTIPAGALLILLASLLVVAPAGAAPSPAAEHPAVFRNGTWFLRPALSSGPSTAFTFGRAGDRPVMGDWDGDGDDTVGVFRDGTRFHRNAISASVVHSFRFGLAGDLPAVWSTSL